MAEKQYYVIRGVQKKQDRDSAGHFLPKKVKYVIKSCPKVSYSRDLNKAKLFYSFERAGYVLPWIHKISNNTYDFDIIKVQVKIEEK